MSGSSKAGGATIEVISRGLILSGSSVLLCRSTKRGHRYLPGGHVEFGESAAAALARELVEEAGVEVMPTDIVQVQECSFHDGRAVHHEINIVFHVEHSLRADSPVAAIEPGVAFDWVDVAAIHESGLVPSLAVDVLKAISRGVIPPAFVSDVPRGT